ncbi:glycosyltransferase [Pectobacterium versatile]|uniref:glycosyltransferase n=1 Tax=Pectobacterium versatile TaxID=2488639 RepID=UPI001B38D373|nr:hypothetical protein [Pectobacterium versatile]MBQ4767924.1 glycosyltransferase [Pectobacterium versatile]
MKILLLGEYSGLHNNLKNGLQELGHDVTLAASGDGFKNFPVDVSFDSLKKGYLGKFERLLKMYFNTRGLVGFDVVQIINPVLFSPRFNFNSMILNYIIKNNGQTSLLGAGCDSLFWKKARTVLPYGPFDDTLKYDFNSKVHPLWDNNDVFEWNLELARRVDHIIPIMYEYRIGYEGFDNVRRCIPIPMNVKKISYKDNLVKNKLFVFHGLNRYGFKGTRVVENAFNILKERYSNDVEVLIEGKMAINDYLLLMEKTNIIIDQVYSHSCGMNAIYALAMGKIVLGGAEPESLDALGFDSTPVFNIKPTPDSIVENIESLLERRNEIRDLGLKARLFVEKNHNYISVAEKYLDTWRIH